MSTDCLPLVESQDQISVRDSARKLLLTEWPAGQAVAMASQPKALRRIWKQSAGQGWTTLGLDDEMGLALSLVLMHELGRFSCPIPLMDAVLANAVLACTQSPEAANLRALLHAGEAVVSWIFGPDSGDADAFELVVDKKIKGRTAYVESAAIVTHFLIVTGKPGELVIVPREAPGLSITTTPGLSVPALAELCFEQVETFNVLHSSFDLQSLSALARLLLAARACGSAQYGLEILTDYAKVRSQFGQKIGQYQAVQHKLANCFTGIEICRLAILAAGRASPQDRLYLAAVASANCGQLLRNVVLELHHGFGGISFWDAHELPRHFRRIHGDLTRLGGVQQSRRDVAAVLLARGAIPDFVSTPDADAFRQEVRNWLVLNWDGIYPPETYALPVNHRKARQEFSRKLGAKGWLGITWPKAYGGQERSAFEHLAFEEEMAYTEAPVTFHNTAANMIAPALISFGSPAQKAYFLPGIASGEISFALGYSEPDHGSDLAGIKTSASRTADGGWLIKGQKIYTSTAGFSTHVWLAVRTDSAQPRHGGISVFVVPLNTPGIVIQPMIGLNGHRSNVVFYDDVKLSADALVGEENGGWKIITEALAYERVTLGAIGARARGYFDRLLAYVVKAKRFGQPMSQDSLVLDRIGALGSEVEASRLLALRTAQVVAQGEVPLWQAAMVKVYASELMERLSEAAFDLLGTGATLATECESALAEGAFEYGVRDALLYSIGGGTNEIQRTLIALRGLDLPR